MDAVVVLDTSEVPPNSKAVDGFHKYTMKDIMEYTGLSYDTVSKEYTSVLRSFRPLPELESTLPTGLDEYIGIHVRKSDKIIVDRTPGIGEMTLDQFDRIFEKTCSYIRLSVLVHGERKFYICSEEDELVEKLRKLLMPLASDIKILTAPPKTEYTQYDNYHVLADFFCLSRCKCIVQGTKWSGFSFIAAIVGDIPLISFVEKADSFVDVKLNLDLGIINVIRI